MAESFIEEIYNYSKIVTALKQTVRELRSGRNKMFLEGINDTYKLLCASCEKCMQMGYPHAREFSENVLRMSEMTDDLMLLGDHVEAKVLPFLCEWISLYADIDVDTEDGYRIKSSGTGYLTACIQMTGKYIHSTYDPMDEAALYIDSLYDPKCSEYVFYGCGMGYYIYQLYRISYGSVRITVYERDANLVTYARHYGVLDWVPESVLNVIIDTEMVAFQEHSDREGVKTVFHLPEVEALDSGCKKEALLQRYIAFNTGHVMKKVLPINVWRNTEKNLPDASEVKETVLSDAVVVAAGPSLDDCMVLLKKWKGNKTIIAVDTVFKKLLSNGIKPDFVTAIDPFSSVAKHLEGVEQENVPLILDYGVYWRWSHDYQGPKYIAYSELTYEEADIYVRQNAKKKWPSGGTVTFLAMEFAIRNRAKRIFFVGADFGYPGGKSHAAGTAFSHEIKREEMLETEAVGGGRIQTDHMMNLYRQSIEQRIAQMGNKIKFYNLSTKGARIKGTIEGYVE